MKEIAAIYEVGLFKNSKIKCKIRFFESEISKVKTEKCWHTFYQTFCLPNKRFIIASPLTHSCPGYMKYYKGDKSLDTKCYKESNSKKPGQKKRKKITHGR